MSHIATQPISPAAANRRRAARRGHPVRGRLNAAFLLLMDGYLNAVLHRRKSELFRDLPRTVVEIGPGIGANFRYFAPGTQVIAIEPNPHMHAALRRRAARRGIELTLQRRGAENSCQITESVDAVVSTLVLCTVRDLETTLHEVHRMLRPGGRFLFLEHVAAEPGTATRRLQERIHRPWSWFFEGCHTHRDTLAALRRADFGHLTFERYNARSLFLPVTPQIAGVATK